MNINKYICTGRLTKDPELRSITPDTNVCQLRIAVDGMGRGREVGYINVTVFGSGGEAAAKHLAKGWLVAVDGRLEYGEWDSDGTKRHDYSVVGNVEFLTAPRPVEDPDPTKVTAKKKQAATA
jgi:single-strand DNA-binding protein